MNLDHKTYIWRNTSIKYLLQYLKTYHHYKLAIALISLYLFHRSHKWIISVFVTNTCIIEYRYGVQGNYKVVPQLLVALLVFAIFEFYWAFYQCTLVFLSCIDHILNGRDIMIQCGIHFMYSLKLWKYLLVKEKHCVKNT